MAIVVILGVSLPDSIAQQIITPHSGIEKPEDVGKKAHTTFKILVPKGFPKFDETKPTNPIVGKPAEPVLPPPIIEQEALDRLKLMSEKLAAAKAFTYRSRSTLEIPAKTGQFLTHFTESDVALERPNKLRYFVTGDVPSFQFYYDGTHASVLDIKKNLYATTQAPATIDEMLPFVMEKYNNDFFSADL